MRTTGQDNERVGTGVGGIEQNPDRGKYLRSSHRRAEDKTTL